MFNSFVYQFNSDRCNSCGYCKQKSTSRSHGMFTHILTVDDYQSLIDRGWRRSGTYCYKPTMKETCCPAYTIKCDTENFKLTKSQKKILNKFNKFLSGDQSQDLNEDDCADGNHSKSQSNPPKVTLKRDTSSTDVTEANTSDTARKNNEENRAGIKKGIGADPNRAPCKKAKLIRQEKKRVKTESKDTAKVDAGNVKSQNVEKNLEDFFTELPENIRNKLQIKLVRTAPLSNEWKATETVSHQLYQKYQMTIHGDSAQKCSKVQFEHFLVKSPLKVKLVQKDSDEYTKSFDKSAALYRLYQMSIHGDEPEDCDDEGFVNFLVDTPLQAETRDSVDFGSFHQQYWLDDNLIAVGVIDILPKCVSSVYFFYDPAYGNLSLGTYGAIREIGFTRQLQQKYADIKNYYMGFYIHSCPKMRYKGNYSPSYLLCPETFQWFSLKDCVEKLDREKYSRLNPNLDAVDTNEFNDYEVSELIVFNSTNSVYLNYSRLKSESRRTLRGDMKEENMLQYGKLIGRECSQRIVMFVT